MLGTALLSGCSSPRYQHKHDSAPDRDIEINQIPDAQPRKEPRSRHGNPDSYVVNGKRYRVMDDDDAEGFSQRGLASWYGKKFHGHRTSSGEPFNMYAMTAAHKTLPLPIYVRVTHLDNGRSIIVRVNDRGPFHKGRIIDLSYAAAKKLGITATGTGKVEIEVIDADDYKRSKKPRQSKTARHDLPDGGKLYLQIGAFSERNNAEKLSNSIKRRFHKLRVSTGYNRSKGVYRVRIGPLASVADADRLAEELSHYGYHDAHVIVD